VVGVHAAEGVLIVPGFPAVVNVHAAESVFDAGQKNLPVLLTRC